jgi:hypothetical protein
MTRTVPQEPTQHVDDAQALIYKDALLHFIDAHSDLQEVGRATDVFRKLERGQRELQDWELELAERARIELEEE